MADTALPAADGVSTMNRTSTRMGSSGDTSWAGWAISSFTYKTTTARGEIQSTAGGSPSTTQNDSRPTSLPASGRTTPAALFSDIPNVGQTEKEPTDTDSLALANQEPDDALNAWGTIEDQDDNLFNAPSSSKRVPSPQPATKYVDDGEPDFAGWLVAQSKANSRKPLPKGLSKSSNTIPAPADRLRSVGTMGSGGGAKKLLKTSRPKETVSMKKIDIQPKETDTTEDGWGDDWD